MEVQFHDTLVRIKRGNGTRINVFCTNTDSYDCVVRGSTVIGSLKQIISATPLEVALIKPNGDEVKSVEKGENTLQIKSLPKVLVTLIQ